MQFGRVHLGDLCSSPLPQAWHFYAGGSVGLPTAFITENEDFAWLVLPKAETESVMQLASTEALSSVAAEVKFIYASSSSGARLFSCAVRSLMETEVGDIIAKGAKKLHGDGITDELRVMGIMRELDEELTNVTGIEALSGRREVTFQYRGIPVVVQVKSVQQQSEWAIRCAIREAAAQSDQLRPLPGEKDFLAASSGPVLKLASSMVSKASRARRLLDDSLQDLEADEKLNGDHVEVFFFL